MVRRRRALLVLSLAAVARLLASPGGALARADAPPTPEDAARVKFFEEKVRPILQANCVKCHGGEKTKAGLRLTSRAAVLAGGDTGPAVVAERAGESLLMQAVGYANDKLQMPPSGKLPQADIDVLGTWVEMGLPWTPGHEEAVPAPAADAHGPPKVDDKARAFWSFKPVVRPAVPEVARREWVRNPVDAFVLAKLEAKGFAPAEPADKVALIRRATYDLTGLPPTPAEVEAFVADARPDAYEQLVERLLASPHYGEKWGRHWLDLVRFAETNSYERDGRKANAWRYRDYVIRSFNDDKPYDRFLTEQLAGDEMPGADLNPDAIVATGFYRLGIWDDEPVDREQARYDGLDDIVATVGQTMLGLTVDCARCHDHKIDPVPQRDYYKLLAFFQNIHDFQNGGPADQIPIFTAATGRDAYAAQFKEYEQRVRAARAAVEEMQRDYNQLVQGERAANEAGAAAEATPPKPIEADGGRVLGPERFARYKQLQKELDRVVREAPTAEKALAVSEFGPQPRETFVLLRGNAHSPGPKVEPGFLEVVSPTEPTIPPPPPGARSSGRRTVLAQWVTSRDNPLTARVMANRIWQYHFGRGIVRSSSNFGYAGDAPTHPELLDWLAAEFVDKGWGMKHMHRLVMTSSAYRMSSAPNPAALAADPRNDLMWRFDMRRLTAEEIRDSILAANGTLNPKMFGPGVFPAIPREVMLGQSRPGEGWEQSPPEEAARRSVYVHAKRSLRVPIIEGFDGAETDKACPVRFVTVQPTQALGMLNGEFLNAEAAKLAERVRKEAGSDVGTQVKLALRLVTSREPSIDEVGRGMKLLTELTESEGVPADRAMNYLCLVALNLNEFVYLD
jgi:hypothetical protein